MMMALRRGVLCWLPVRRAARDVTVQRVCTYIATLPAARPEESCACSEDDKRLGGRKGK